MKNLKHLIALIFVMCLTTAIFAVPTGANDTNESNWSSLFYYDVPVLKILDSNDAFVVIYQKNRIGTGTTVIPKKWLLGNKDNPRKLKLRWVGPGKLGSLLTVIKKDGEFNRVILTIPKSKGDPAWGVVPSGTKVDGADKDSLEELDLW